MLQAFFLIESQMLIVASDATPTMYLPSGIKEMACRQQTRRNVRKTKSQLLLIELRQNPKLALVRFKFYPWTLSAPQSSHCLLKHFLGEGPGAPIISKKKKKWPKGEKPAGQVNETRPSPLSSRSGSTTAVFLEFRSRKAVFFSEHIMSKDKYSSILSKSERKYLMDYN